MVNTHIQLDVFLKFLSNQIWILFIWVYLNLDIIEIVFNQNNIYIFYAHSSLGVFNYILFA